MYPGGGLRSPSRTLPHLWAGSWDGIIFFRLPTQNTEEAKSVIYQISNFSISLCFLPGNTMPVAIFSPSDLISPRFIEFFMLHYGQWFDHLY